MAARSSALVAPYVGAWIETVGMQSVPGLALVAPYVGAWIETVLRMLEVCGQVTSHPTWVRGLKHDYGYKTEFHQRSHPTWVRGLKP